MTFDSLGLRAELLRALSTQGYTEPTPIQIQSIPLVLAGRDVLAGAQTGTGKTAGFVLPMLQHLSASSPERSGKTATPSDRSRRASGRGPSPVRALILTPTRELASQVEESVRTYGANLPHRSLAIFGGVSIVPQIQRLRTGVDIVVATPGRLLDHLNQKTLDLSRVEILVLDEADRMLDMGFIRDIRKILAKLPTRRQTLLFSATFSDEIRKLANDFMNDPVSVQATPGNAAAEMVIQEVHPVDKGKKRELLSHLIETGAWKQVLVFTKTKHGANRLATQLTTDGITSTAIHGNKSQANRTRALRDFKRGAVRVLVATDIAARGLDIDQLPHVVNYDLSLVPEDYIHRIGRTGRAGREGTAISLVSAEEHDLLRGIERILKRDLPRSVIPGFEPRIAIPTARTAPTTTAKRSRGPAGGTRPGARKPAARRSGSRPAGAQSARGVDTSRAKQASRAVETSGRVQHSRAAQTARPAETPRQEEAPLGKWNARRPRRTRRNNGPGMAGSKTSAGRP